MRVLQGTHALSCVFLFFCHIGSQAKQQLFVSNIHTHTAIRSFFLTVDRKECLWVPPPPVLQTLGSSSVAPPLALTAVALPADADADALAVGRDSKE